MPYRTPPKMNQPSMQQVPNTPRIKYGVLEIVRIMPWQWFPRAAALVLRRALANSHLGGKTRGFTSEVIDDCLKWSEDPVAMKDALRDKDGYDHYHAQLEGADQFAGALRFLHSSVGCLWAVHGGPRLAQMDARSECKLYGRNAIERVINQEFISEQEASGILYGDAFRQLPRLLTDLPGDPPTDDAVHAAIAVIQSGTSRDILPEILGMSPTVERYLREKGFL